MFNLKAENDETLHGDKLYDKLFDDYPELDGFGGSEFDEQSRIEYWGARAPSAQPR